MSFFVQDGAELLSDVVAVLEMEYDREGRVAGEVRVAFAPHVAEHAGQGPAELGRAHPPRARAFLLYLQ